jgi:hypothetical protein
MSLPIGIGANRRCVNLKELSGFSWRLSRWLARAAACDGVALKAVNSGTLVANDFIFV